MSTATAQRFDWKEAGKDPVELRTGVTGRRYVCPPTNYHNCYCTVD